MTKKRKPKERQPPMFTQYRITERDLGKTQLTVGGQVVNMPEIKSKDVGKVVHLNRRITA